MKIIERVQQGPWWVKGLGLILIPILVVAMFLGATWNSNARLHKVEAAVVNLDKAVTLNGQIVPMGRQMSAQLVDSSREQNFTWVLADAASAANGLKSGRYAAVVTIPENFSAAATSFGGAAADAKQATIQVQTSPIAGIADTAIGQEVAQAAALALNRTLTQTYLDNIYIGFNDMGKQFATVADGAKQLADGSRQVTDGIGSAATGADQLADGLSQMSQNTQAIRDGGSQLVSGGNQLVSGIEQAASGASSLSSGMSQLSEGSAQLRTGASQLATGQQQLATGLTTFKDTGLTPYTQGVTQLATSTKQQLDLLIQVRTLLDQIQATGANVDTTQLITQVQQGITALQQQLTTSQGAVEQVAGQLTNAQKTINTGLDQVSAQMTAQCPTQVQQLGPEACQAYAAGVTAAITASKQQVAQAFTTVDPNTGLTLQQQLDRLSTQLKAIGTPGVQSLLTQLQSLLTQIKPLASSGMPTVAELNAQKGQLDQMIAAGPQLVNGAGQLATGAQQSATGMKAYADGINAYTSGVDKAATGAAQLSTGLQQASSGSRTYVNGVAQYVSGINTLLGGIDQAAPGAKALADGLHKLQGGSQELTDGTQKLADGLAEGAKQVPSYNQTERENLAKVVASPVSVSGLDTLVMPGLSWVSLLVVLSLWLGALATYIVVPPLRRRLALSDHPTWRLAAESMVPGALVVAIQTLAVSIIAQVALRLPAGRFVGLVAFLLVAGMAFVSVNHALAAWGKGVGRVVAVVMALITSAVAITSALPGVFDVLRPLSPLTPALDGVRALASGGTGTTAAVLMLLAWLAVGAVASGAAVLRSRTVSVRSLMAATA